MSRDCSPGGRPRPRATARPASLHALPGANRWSLIQHEFLRRERLAGRTLPRTQEEMEWMLRQRPTSRAFRMLRSESMRMQGRMRASKVARPRGFAAERGLRLVN
mmetsp:Transcript_12422/g.40048  ORF Transcript_12422/g.40048 Transcript_12422/m.40048 type:complete len:105 (+) Transcript_12422:756-1070(+)